MRISIRPLYVGFNLTRSDARNLLEIESLMARRLRARKRDRILLALNCGKISKEVKTLTTKLEDSHRNFMVQTERLPSRLIPLMARLSLDSGCALHPGHAGKREPPYATAHRRLSTRRRDCRSRHQRDPRWHHAPHAARQWERHVRWKCEYLNLLTAS